MQKLFGNQKIEGPETLEDSNKHTGRPKVETVSVERYKISKYNKSAYRKCGFKISPDYLGTSIERADL